MRKKFVLTCPTCHNHFSMHLGTNSYIEIDECPKCKCSFFAKTSASSIKFSLLSADISHENIKSA